MNYKHHYSAESDMGNMASTRLQFGRVYFVGVMLLLSLLSVSAYAANMLNDITFAPMTGDSVQIRMKLSSAAPEPGTFTIDNPARLVIDLPGTQLGNVPRRQNVNLGVARSVQAVAAGGRTRIVLNLVHMAPFVVNRDKDDLILVVGDASETIQASAPSENKSKTKAIAANEISNVDFRRGSNGEGRVIITLSNSAMVADISNHGKDKIIVNFTPALVPDKLQRRLNVMDFATPVNTIDTYAHGDGVRMEIATAPDAESLSYQTGDTLTIEVKRKTKEEAAAQKQKYTGQKLSLNFQNIEVRAVLQLLADFTGLNLVTSDSVKGNITLRLKDVPWDEALDIILKARGLGMRRMGDVIMVAPSEEIAAREKLELEAQKQLTELAPLDSESIQINYAKASDIAALLKSKNNSLLSSRGSVSIDDRTNKLLIRDTDENIAAVRKLVTQLDVPVRQVMIESRVVLATDDFSKELGVRFGVTNVSNNNPVGTGSSTIVSTSGAGTSAVISGTTPTDTYNVNLPVTNLASTAGSLGLAIAKLPIGTLVQLELSAAQAEGQTEVVSSPRVVTANQKEATIEQGVEIPYQQATSSGATTVTFKKAVLSLKVTPQITPNDAIIMDLTVNKDSPDYANAVLGQPPINTQNISTQVLVNNGETIVLGGVYEQNKQHQSNRIPFFADLPLIGALFRSNYNTDQKSELLIFVTPKILKQNAMMQ